MLSFRLACLVAFRWAVWALAQTPLFSISAAHLDDQLGVLEHGQNAGLVVKGVSELLTHLALEYAKRQHACGGTAHDDDQWYIPILKDRVERRA